MLFPKNKKLRQRSKTHVFVRPRPLKYETTPTNIFWTGRFRILANTQCFCLLSTALPTLATLVRDVIFEQPILTVVFHNHPQRCEKLDLLSSFTQLNLVLQCYTYCKKVSLDFLSAIHPNSNDAIYCSRCSWG